jgi:hypothetical protein
LSGSGRFCFIQFGIKPAEELNVVFFIGGELGNHLWAAEGTGCVNGCGIFATGRLRPQKSMLRTSIEVHRKRRCPSES